MKSKSAATRPIAETTTPSRMVLQRRAHYFRRGVDSAAELSLLVPVVPDDMLVAFVSIFWNMSHEATVPVT